jgi:MoaA/NifB/PqqE/SkfB family radical SAM enzyme
MSGQRWRQILRRGANLPASIHLNLTDRCACRCQRCEMGSHGTGRELPWPLVETLLELAADLDCPVMLSGGEPLLHSRRDDILRAAAARAVPIWLMTGGHELAHLLRTDTMPALAPGSTVLVSLDSADADRNDRRRGRAGSHAAVLEALQRARGRFATTIVAVAEPGFGNIPGLIDLAAGQQVPLVVQPCIYLSNFPDREAAPAKADTRAELASLAGEIGRRVAASRRRASRRRLPSNLDLLQAWLPAYYAGAGRATRFQDEVLPRFTCSIPTRQLTVGVDGVVQPCVFLVGTTSLLSTDDPLAAWQAAARRFREAPYARWATPACNSCACHMSANYRDSILKYPWANRRAFVTYARYVARRRFEAWRLRREPR